MKLLILVLALQIFGDETIPHYRTSGTKDLELIQKEFLSILNKAVDAAIDHQQNNNATEPWLQELKEMLRTVNGTELEELQAQNMDAMRHGQLNVSIGDMAKIFMKRKKKQQKLDKAAEKNRQKMRKKNDKWEKREAKKANRQKHKDD